MCALQLPQALLGSCKHHLDLQQHFKRIFLTGNLKFSCVRSSFKEFNVRDWWYLLFIVVGMASGLSMHNNHVSNMINGHHAFCRHTNHARLEVSLEVQQQFVQHLLQHRAVRFWNINSTTVDCGRLPRAWALDDAWGWYTLTAPTGPPYGPWDVASVWATSHSLSTGSSTLASLVNLC